MKVVVITGSPHKNGTSALLADAFIRGASDAGHSVFRFDAAAEKVHPCIACEVCHKNKRGCAFQDAMVSLNVHLLSADAVVFVSPIYYYGMTAQIKTVIDRFYANDEAMHHHKKSAQLLTFADSTEKTACGAVETFRGMLAFLDWKNAGTLLAPNCSTREDIEKTTFPQQAYEMGRTF